MLWITLALILSALASPAFAQVGGSVTYWCATATEGTGPTLTRADIRRHWIADTMLTRKRKARSCDRAFIVRAWKP